MDEQITYPRINIQYNFTMRCNQHCSYCWFHRILNKKETYEPTIENIDTVIKHLKMYQINDFTVSGGEPSINNKTLYLIDKIINELDCSRIKILTNAYNRKFFEELLKRYDTNKFYIYMAMHPQYYSKKYVENYIFIKENFPEYTLSLLLDKRYKENLFSFVPVYKQHFVGKTYFNGIRCVNDNAEIGINYVFQHNAYNNLKFLDEIAKRYEISLSKDIIEWKRVPSIYQGKRCINNFFFINHDGTIKYDEECFGKPLTPHNIYESPYIFPYNETICHSTYQCWRMCIYDYVIHPEL